MIKGAWLNSQDELVSSYSIPSYEGLGRAAPGLSLTEELVGMTEEDGPVNYTVPYIDQYLVRESPQQAASRVTIFFRA